MPKISGPLTINASITGTGNTGMIGTLSVQPDVPDHVLLYTTSSLLYVTGSYTGYVLPDNNFASAPMYAVVQDKYNNNNTTAFSTISFTTAKGTVSSPTDSNGIAGPIYSGPFSSPTLDNIKATASTFSSSTFTINYLDCVITQSVSSNGVTVGTDVKVTTTVSIGGNHYITPITYYVTKPGNTTQTFYTNTYSNGTAFYNVTIGTIYGMNYIVGCVDKLGIYYTSAVWGINGAPATITLTKTPIGINHDTGGNVFADGTSVYLLEAAVKDAKGNPVPSVNVNFIDSYGGSWTVLTDDYGLADIDSGASNFVRSSAVIAKESINNNTASVTLNYVAGPPAMINIRAIPNVIASSNVSDIAGTEIHGTNISAILTDNWYNPIAGKQISFSVVTASPSKGTITWNVVNNTDSTGTAYSYLLLNKSYNGTDKDFGTVTVEADLASSTIKGYGNIIFTTNSFLGVQTSIKPKNATLNNNITVSVNITGIGWMTNSTWNDVYLLQDISSSMAWMADIDQNSSFDISGVNNSTTHVTGYKDSMGIEHGTIPAGTNWNNNSQWYYVGTYHLSAATKAWVNKWDPMFGWDWRNYLPGTGGGTGSGNTFYLMRVLTPDNKAYEPNFVTTPAGYTHKDMSPGYGLTETIWTADDTLATGDYKIYAYYQKGTVAGASEYRLSIETNENRIGSAQKALDAFVDNTQFGNRVGFIPYDANAETGQSLTYLNRTSDKTGLKTTINSKTIGSGTNTYLGIQAALDSFNASSKDPKVHRSIVLVTDGYSYNPGNDLAEAAVASAMGVKIYTIGIGACDVDTLQTLADNTGGSFYLAANANDLATQFAALANNMNAQIAVNSSINLLADRSLVNSTYMNNTEFVPGSSWIVSTKHPIKYSMEPGQPVISNDTNTYSLTWYPGAINISDYWDLTYNLTIKTMGDNGTVYPILGQSNIWFQRPDGTTTTSLIDKNGVKVSPNDSAMTKLGEDIEVRNPAAKMNGEYMDITWDVWYNGSSTYTNVLNYTYNGVTNGLIATIPGYNNATPLHSFVYHWDIGPSGINLPTGEVKGTITAWDINNTDTKPFSGSITDTSGRIILS